VELSAFYLDIAKDRLYTAAPNSLARRSAQTALYRISDALVRLVAPILCFTSEEIWGYLPGRSPETVSVHLSQFPQAAELSAGLTAAQMERLQNWDRLIVIRNEVLKVLEVSRREKCREKTHSRRTTHHYLGRKAPLSGPPAGPPRRRSNC